MNRKRRNESCPPDVLSVEEVAAVLRIGRAAAYRQANQFIDSDGADGFPAKRVGRQLLVPRAAFEEWLGGPITWPPPRRESMRASPPATPSTPSKSRSGKLRRLGSTDEQPPLPFSA